MSNTYRQLITALNIDDLTYVLSKYGDAKVGTNSPLAIKHKRNGRIRSWICWLLLICTSLVRLTHDECFRAACKLTLINAYILIAGSFPGELPHSFLHGSPRAKHRKRSRH